MSMFDQEMRGGWLGVPEPYHPLDFLGVALGSFFIWQSWRDQRPLGLALGGLMIFIHGQRFFYAPQSREGLERLLASLDLTWADVCPP